MRGPASAGAPPAQDVWAARRRIRDLVAAPPVVPSLPLSERWGGRVHLQLEYANAVGSFKVRGAANALRARHARSPLVGVATFSTGNHGAAVAYVAQDLGIPAAVFVPEGVPPVKIRQLERWGADVHVGGASQAEAASRCEERAQAEGWWVVPPFDHPDVIAGQGTAGLDLLDRCPEVDTVLVPVSGGGLLAGVALVLKAAAPAIRIVGIGARQAPSMAASVRAGRPVAATEGPTWADSLLGGLGADNQHTLRLVRRLVDDMVEVSEEEIAGGLRFLLREHRIVVEGAAAVGVGALLGGHVPPGAAAAVLLTGNAVDPERVCALLS